VIHQIFFKNCTTFIKLLQKDESFHFEEDYRIAFEKLKVVLTSAPIVKPPN